jgi:hypothetical protein
LLVNDIGTALRFVDEDFGGVINNLQSLLSSGEITFDLLWAIFPPGEVVVTVEHGLLRQSQAFPVLTADYGQHRNGERYFWARGKIITHDGQDFGKGTFVPTIEAFEGSRKLTTLEFLPMKFHPEEIKLRQSLIARGQKYVSFLKNPVCREYSLHYAVAENELIVQRTERNPEKLSVSLPYGAHFNQDLHP